jgi:hypothetical protein
LSGSCNCRGNKSLNGDFYFPFLRRCSPLNQHAFHLAVVLPDAGLSQRIEQRFVVVVDIPTALIRRIQNNMNLARSLDGRERPAVAR